MMNMSLSIANDRTAVWDVEWLKQASTSRAISAMAKPTRTDIEEASIAFKMPQMCIACFGSRVGMACALAMSASVADGEASTYCDTRLFWRCGS